MDTSGRVGRPNNMRLNRVRCCDADAWQTPEYLNKGRCNSPRNKCPTYLDTDKDIYTACECRTRTALIRDGERGKGRREKGKGKREKGRENKQKKKKAQECWHAGMLLLVVVGCACPTVRAAVACSVVR